MIWAGMALIVTFYAACIIATLVNCIPLDQLVPGSNPEEWMEAFENDRCSKPELLITLIQGFFSAITDLYGKKSTSFRVLQACFLNLQLKSDVRLADLHKHSI